MNASIPLETLLQACESEQLHLSGAIQPFGALLRVDTATGVVTHASANLIDYAGIASADLLGRPIDESGWLTTGAFARLPESPGDSLIVPNLLPASPGRLDGLLIRGESCVLVELERNEVRADPLVVLQLQRPLFTIPNDDDEVAAYHDTLLQAFHALTEFDRIMLYRFHDDWSGEVIAETTSGKLGNYLGLRFPASDIPEIARRLYLLNPSRMIPDAQAEPVPILGIDHGAPDLTWSNLRSVSPVHLQYLRNMGAGASFSVPIRTAGRLWGLVACHHLSARSLSPDQRKSCVDLANAYSLGLTSYVASRRLQAIDSLDRHVGAVVEALSHYANPLDGVEMNGRLLMEAMSAEGFAMAVNNDVVISGDGPDLEGMSLVDGWFVGECKDFIAITDHLESLFPGQASILTAASGMIAIKARSPRSGWVRFYWFRRGAPQEVAWAGNPDKPVVENAGAVMLSPRRSFEKWIEIKTGFSRAWSSEEKLIAAKIRGTLLQWL